MIEILYIFALFVVQHSDQISHTIIVDTKGEKSVKNSGYWVSNIVACIALKCY